MVNSSTPALTSYFDSSNEYYQITFEFESNSDLLVFITYEDYSRALLELDSDYQIINGNTVKLINPTKTENAKYVSVIRKGTETQEFVFNNGTYLNVKNIEKALDLMTLWLQEIRLQADNTFQAAPEDITKRIGIYLPSIDERKGKIMYFKDDGVTIGLVSFTEIADMINHANTSVALARAWAIKMESAVEGENYSSKYYALKAKEYKESSELLSEQITEKTEEAMRQLDEHTEELLSIRMAYHQTIGDGSTKTFSIKHNLNTMHFVSQIWADGDNEPAEWKMQKVDKNNVTITFAVAPAKDSVEVVFTALDKAEILTVEWSNVLNVVITEDQLSKDLALTNNQIKAAFEAV